MSYVCGFCGDKISTRKGYSLIQSGGSQLGGLYLCPNCNCPTFFLNIGSKERYPTQAIGSPVNHVPASLNSVYEEARKCTSHGCHTAAVMLCRTILMHIAVDKGAKTGQTFAAYVTYLGDQGFVPPNGKAWVDHIRKKGNDAVHEIHPVTENDARDLLTFTEMLLKFIYEFPSMVPAPPATKP